MLRATAPSHHIRYATAKKQLKRLINCQRESDNKLKFCVTSICFGFEFKLSAGSTALQRKHYTDVKSSVLS